MPYTSKQVLSKLLKAGFIEKRRSGSHVILRHPDGRQTYVSIHTKDLPQGTMQAILKQAGFTEEDFRKV